jgi:hypothetical protein
VAYIIKWKYSFRFIICNQHFFKYMIKFAFSKGHSNFQYVQ